MSLIENLNDGIGSSSDDWQRADRGNMEKLLAMLILGLGSFLSGMLPAIISERNRRRFPLTISLLLCYGAGILLATALVHILPEVRAQMSSNFAEIALCGGFFIIYFVDEFIHYFFGEAIQHSHSHAQADAAHPIDAATNNHSYGSIDEHAPLLSTNETSSHSHAHHTARGHDNRHEENATSVALLPVPEHCLESITGTLGLFVALSLHSLIEGLTIGIQNSATKVLFMLGAVACHKFVMGFCLGLECRSRPQSSFRSQLMGVSVFASGAVAGIGLGMLIVNVPTSWSTITLPVIQALAGGTLFYVTVCEVIPREKARWHHSQTRKLAGFAQFFASVAGFTTMCILNFYLSDGD